MTPGQARSTFAASIACAGTWSVSFRVSAADVIGNVDFVLLLLLGMLAYGGARALLERREGRLAVTLVTLFSAALALWLTHGRRNYHLAIYAVTPAVMCAASWVAQYYLSPIPLGVGAISFASAIVFAANRRYGSGYLVCSRSPLPSPTSQCGVGGQLNADERRPATDSAEREKQAERQVPGRVEPTGRRSASASIARRHLAPFRQGW